MVGYGDEFDDDEVCCDGCDVWEHVECAEICGKNLKDLEDAEYYCPDCKPKFAFEPSYSVALPEVNPKQPVPSDEVTVACNGMEASYIPSLHLVVCKCGKCGTRK
uniref:PHD-type domain-containing protein n=1 Tax=Chenopodium quinoa TaxID=63459 RepID=A0A803L3T2_CHEQI